jgi:hypothetical protein
MIAPLAMLDTRQLKKPSSLTRGARCANFLYGPRKSEFGDSLVKVLFLERTVPGKKTRSDIRLVGFDFFQELPDWQVTD